MSGAGEATDVPPRLPPSVAPLLLRADSLRTVYQPIVDLRSGEPAGYEALTRIAGWPARDPRPWFEAAACSGLGAEFEAAALRRALLPRAELPPGLFLSLNVDPAVLDDAEVTGVLLDEPDLHGLVLDLTPSTGPADGPALSALRTRGALVAVDVGTGGVGELHRVLTVRPDVVQLGRDLVQDVHLDPVRERLVGLAVRVAREIGAVTLAQVIELPAQARQLQFLGVTLGQGWLFGRARPGFLPASAEAAACLRAAWEELVALTTVRALTVPLPESGWRAELDPTGRLRGLRDRSDRFRPLHELVRLRPGQDLLSAAHRVLSDGRRDVARDWDDVVPVLDEAGSLVGIVPVHRLLEAALLTADPTRAGSP